MLLRRNRPLGPAGAKGVIARGREGGLGLGGGGVVSRPPGVGGDGGAAGGANGEVAVASALAFGERPGTVKGDSVRWELRRAPGKGLLVWWPGWWRRWVGDIGVDGVGVVVEPMREGGVDYVGGYVVGFWVGEEGVDHARDGGFVDVDLECVVSVT